MRDSWRKYLFKNVIKSTQLGTNLIGNEKNTGIPLLKMGNLTIGGFSFNKLEKIEYSKSYEAEKFILKKGDFLFNTRNTLELVGKSAVWNNNLSEAIFNSNIMRIKFEEDKADDFFLGYYFSQGKGWNEFKRISTGTTSVAAIYSRDLFECEIKIPPLPQQRKIAEILSTVDAVLEKTEAAIAKYQQLKQGLMQDLFTRGIDVRSGKLRPKQKDAPDLYQASELGWIPKEWEVCSIGEYSQITKLAGFEYTNYFDYSIGGEIIAIRALNLKKGKLDLTKIHTIPKKTSKFLTRSQLKKGDVVISYVGTLGEVAVIPIDNRFHLAPNVAKITVEECKINPFYLNEYLASSDGQKEIFRWAASTTQAALSMENLRQVRVIIPDITEQKLIYERLDVVNSKVAIEEAFLTKYQQLKAGLMQDLLTGEVSV